MLEGLVDKVELEIIAVKKSPAKWSEFELQWYELVIVEDDELESKVDDVIVYPYRQTLEDGTVIKKVVRPDSVSAGKVTAIDLVEIKDGKAIL